MKFFPQPVCKSFCFDKIRQMSAEIYVMIASFVKIGAVETVFYLGA
jgi:hypothetical protein